MQLVEQHVITQQDVRFALIDAAAFAAKNLYNAANYVIRQAFIVDGLFLNYQAMHRRMKTTEPYRALPRKVSQQVLKLLDGNWQSYFAALKRWEATPEVFTGKPRFPGYLDKTRGRFALVYTLQAISRPALAQQVIKPSGLAIEVMTRQTGIAQVRIVPRSGCYVVEVIYERAVEPAAVNPELVAGIDMGLNNLAAIASNKSGFTPVLVNGRPLKHINQFYHKRKAHLQAKLGRTGTTALMERITTRRTRKITHYLHTQSHRIMELLVEEGIGTLVIGKNDGWKQALPLGRRTNQNFVQVPHARFIEMLTYKAQLVGIKVVAINESHTSKCSFFDNEPVAHHDQYVGRRIKRGLFRTRDGRLINADVNGAYNIIRKAIPNAFGNGIGGVVGHPIGSAPTY
jgi:putative transposase